MNRTLTLTEQRNSYSLYIKLCENIEQSYENISKLYMGEDNNGNTLISFKKDGVEYSLRIDPNDIIELRTYEFGQNVYRGLKGGASNE